ncbi:CopD family protein [Sphingomonas nostoxanthinifaciens]|uniref:CopD family protein n=1 Tax=Sphingomonas nostoxanthinifaciens TaxID=2872652 RepID=UPI001CC21F04|nr:CopD family protein [Sphingomonas nostoxanthinifaciens]UAK25930.1 CopD family protein [Sphingomonas nostoxanthinifaciens]
MSYPAVLGIHLVAVLLFLSCFFMTAFLRRLTSDAPLPSPNTQELQRLRRLNAFVATPALAGVWAAGISLAIQGGWFVMGWLQIKLALVLLISAMHVYQVVALRRQAAGHAAGGDARFLLPVSLLLAVAVVGLVVTKPF